MDKTKMTMAAAVSAAVGLPAGAALAHEPAVPPAASYADLLKPVPNAAERLTVADAEAAARPRLVEAQYNYYYNNNHHHHHHHHHQNYYRQGYWWGGRYYYWGTGPRFRQYHHHHHHHHQYQYRDQYQYQYPHR